jgi:hypothetical protein
MVEHEPEPRRFEPKVPVQLDPPKDDPISVEDLAKCDGKEDSQLHELYCEELQELRRRYKIS